MAISAIGTRSLAIDIYIWLAYRLHALPKVTRVSWPAIHTQFGAGFRLIRQIKPTFTDALMVALAVYPEARVDVEKEGIVMHPSAPAAIADFVAGCADVTLAGLRSPSAGAPGDRTV